MLQRTPKEMLRVLPGLNLGASVKVLTIQLTTLYIDLSFLLLLSFDCLLACS